MFQNYNRKIHIHLGLLLVLFIWLFSFSGLILNHGNWKFTSFWEEREETLVEFHLPDEMKDKAITKEIIIEYLKIQGEIQVKDETSEQIQLRIESPGMVNDIQIDLISGAGTRKQLKYNTWGKLRGLHTFNGVDRNASADSPNWWITNVWRFSMDVIGVGLIILCVSSWIMWYKVRREFKWGWPTLIVSLLLTGYFIFFGFF